MINMNRPNGYNFNPQGRANTHGLINLSSGAVNMARGATHMLMTAGGTVATGDAAAYTYVWRTDISAVAPQISFVNHNYDKGGAAMPIQQYTVIGLKGETDTYTRFNIGVCVCVYGGCGSVRVRLTLRSHLQPHLSVSRGVTRTRPGTAFPPSRAHHGPMDPSFLPFTAAMGAAPDR